MLGREGMEATLWGIPRESLNPSFQGFGDGAVGKGGGLCLDYVSISWEDGVRKGGICLGFKI